MRAAGSKLLKTQLSLTDFVLRLAFFAAAPFAIVAAAWLFPVKVVLFDVALALTVFLTGEGLRRSTLRSRFLKSVLRDALAFETYYRSRPPRMFLYYALYPLLFPYWLLNRDARREFMMFRGYVLGGLMILVAVLAWHYYAYWQPELSVRDFLPTVLVTLAVQALLVLALLMPMATTVVCYHSSGRRRRLFALLVVGLLSTGVAIVRLSSRRDPIVSYSTRERVKLRTHVRPDEAHAALLAAAQDGLVALGPRHVAALDGKVEGPPLERIRSTLTRFYRADESLAFDAWESDPSVTGRALVVYFEARRRQPGIWLAVNGDGKELHSLSELPAGAARAMRRAADSEEPLLPMWRTTRSVSTSPPRRTQRRSSEPSRR